MACRRLSSPSPSVHISWSSQYGVEVSEELVERLLCNRLAQRATDGSSDWSFVHGMLRETALAEVDERDLGALHRACAEAVADPRRRGCHLMSAGDPTQAAPFLLEAVKQVTNLRASGRLEVRLDDLWAAMDAAGMEDDHPTRFSALIHRATLLQWRGQLDESQSICDEVIRQTEGLRIGSSCWP